MEKYGKLIFEGEYINGKKNGKDYNNKNNLINKDGFCREYYNDDVVKFEGEYKNGKRNGKGKEFDEYGKIIF